VTHINKYRGTYRVYRELDNNEQLTTNDDATYIKCKSTVIIYRYNSDILAVQFNSTGYKNNRIKELSDVGVCLTTLQSGDNESVYLFKESDFNKVAEILKPQTKGAKKSPTSCAKKPKRELTEEQREVLRTRMKLIREKSNK
jgi:hypothetical protein